MALRRVRTPAAFRKNQPGKHSGESVHIRDRIKDFRRIRAGDLRPHPRNWRTHPDAQRDAMRGVLSEIGYADALVARELADGSLELIDGHLRAETTPDMQVPVLVVDLDDQEALKLLATLDPLSGMAERDSQMLSGLIAELHTDNEAVRAMLAALGEQPPPISGTSGDYQDLVIENTFQVVVECENEDEQRELFERLRDEGLKCRVLSL